MEGNLEAMALESLVASTWRLEGFLAVTRHPVRVQSGYSDVDVIGVRGAEVRVAECKARGGAQRVNVDDATGWSTWWDASIDNLDRIWQDAPRWLPKAPTVTSLEFHLVGNVWYEDEMSHAKANARLTRAVRERLPKEMHPVAQGYVTPSIDLLLHAAKVVREQVVTDGWGKRYGDPLLDAVRELVRFAHPRPAGGGRAARSAISDGTRAALIDAVFGDRPE